MKLFLIAWLLAQWLIPVIYGHAINNKKLLSVHPLTTVKLDIAKRSEHFFQKRDISPNKHYSPHTPSSLEHDDSLRLKLDAYNSTIYLHLQPNHDLFHPNAMFYQDGQETPLRPSDFRVYRGFVVDDRYSDHMWSYGDIHDEMEGEPGVLGWARITVRHDIRHDLDHPLFEGTFTMHGDTYHVKLVDNYQLTKRSDDAVFPSNTEAHLAIYRDSDTTVVKDLYGNTASECGFDKMTQPLEKRYNPLDIVPPGMDHTDLFKNKYRAIGNTLMKRAPAGCPASKKILYMGAAADCTYVKAYETANQARIQIINDWNSVSGLYTSSFNVGIGLINITVMDSACPSSPISGQAWNQECSTGYSISSRLSDFSQWRGRIGDDGAGLWHLMTNCATGPEVGLAWLSQVCTVTATDQGTNGEGYTSGTGVSAIIRDEWKVVAHEIGHGFGAQHDCNSDTCPCSGSSCQCCPYSDTQCDAQERYIMNPTSNSTATEFSPCSIKTVCGQMSNYLSCLHDPGSRNTTSLQMCGNGIKETGEDCDPGGTDSACCDPKTCKFKAGAVCDDFNDLCCNNCQLRPSNYTCRAATSSCDIPEVCDGKSGDCPEDKHVDDLTDCGNGRQCASGQCTSKDDQCTARGVTIKSTKACSGVQYSSLGCQVACLYPNSNQCYVFSGYYVDGTSCGVGGVCNAGNCDTKNFGNNVKSWIDNHKQIVIPVAIVVGLLLLFCIFRCCCYGGSRGYSNIGSTYVVTSAAAPPQYNGQYNTQPYYPPPPANGQQYYTPPPNNPSGWVDPVAYNGSGPNRGLQTPPPVYSNASGPQPPTHDSYELNNAQSWQNSGPNSPRPQSPHNNVNLPQQMPVPPPHNSNARPYNEGVV